MTEYSLSVVYDSELKLWTARLDTEEMLQDGGPVDSTEVTASGVFGLLAALEAKAAVLR